MSIRNVRFGAPGWGVGGAIPKEDPSSVLGSTKRPTRQDDPARPMAPLRVRVSDAAIGVTGRRFFAVYWGIRTCRRNEPAPRPGSRLAPPPQGRQNTTPARGDWGGRIPEVGISDIFIHPQRGNVNRRLAGATTPFRPHPKISPNQRRFLVSDKAGFITSQTICFFITNPK
jgi:hypothetical protein